MLRGDGLVGADEVLGWQTNGPYVRCFPTASTLQAKCPHFAT